MTTTQSFGRVFNAARKRQGFHSQAQLDAFYRHQDHVSGCGICSRVGGYVPLDDGMQPVMDACADGRALYGAYAAIEEVDGSLDTACPACDGSGGIVLGGAPADDTGDACSECGGSGRRSDG